MPHGDHLELRELDTISGRAAAITTTSISLQTASVVGMHILSVKDDDTEVPGDHKNLVEPEVILHLSDTHCIYNYGIYSYR